MSIEEYWNQLPLLDQVFNSPQYAGTPVVLAGYVHTGWANRAMLEKAGIDLASIENLDLSIKTNFGVSADGKLNGYVSEGAWDLVLASLPPVDEQVIVDAIRTGC
ncbi:MAG: hypothetical protein WCZ18_04825 [Ottowia sp.]|nr:hypothetical protein [Ottowia sp.]